MTHGKLPGTDFIQYLTTQRQPAIIACPIHGKNAERALYVKDVSVTQQNTRRHVPLPKDIGTMWATAKGL